MSAERKLRVAIDTSSMDGRVAMGTAVFIRELVEHLKPYKDSLDITLVHREKFPNDPLYKAFNELIIPRISLPRGGGYLSELFFFLTPRKRFDVYHFGHLRIPHYFFLAPGKIITSMQYDGGAATVTRDIGNTADKFKSWMMPLIRRYMDAFIATSEFGREGLIGRGLPKEKVYTFHGGADALFRPIPKAEALAYLRKKYNLPDAPLIAASGRLDPHKNMHRLVEAFALLKKQSNIPHILIASGGAHSPGYSEQVFESIKKHGLEKEFLVMRLPDFADMPYLYSAADLMVFPSLYEGFGLPLVEAMQCAVPTVTARGSSLTEVGGDATEFVDPLDVEDMARGISRVLSDKAYAQELVVRGLEQAKKFTWENHAAGIVRMWTDLTGTRT